jgi:glycosyltransferase involved in cell wall biosynthesis
MEAVHPEVTVLMSVYNGETYLHEAIESILNQTFSNFEFIIINDASTDNSIQIIQHYQDKRIKLIHNQKNLGLTKSLNKGLKLAKGKYIARMDADDISLPERLEKQVNFMNNRPEIGICGTWFQFSSENKIKRHPTTHKEILTALFDNNAIGHPTSMLRKSILTDFNLCYNETFLAAQDYELWVRGAKVTQLANISEVLVFYRSHKEQVSNRKKNAQKNYAFDAKVPLIKELLGDISEIELNLYRSLLVDNRKYTTGELKILFQLLRNFLYKNEIYQTFEPERFHKIIFKQYRKLSLSAQRYNLTVFHFLRLSPCFTHLEYEWKIKLFLKSLLGSLSLAR